MASQNQTQSTSARLLVRVRQGDAHALELLFGRLLPYLQRWGRGRLPRWARRGLDTADIVQDVLVKTLGRLEAFEPRQEQALRAYLRQAVRNRINDELRRSARVGLPLDSDQVDASPRASPEAVAAFNERRSRYLDALQRLDDYQRELVFARMELEYSYEQIALMTGRKTPDAARMAVRRALEQLAEYVDGP